MATTPQSTNLYHWDIETDHVHLQFYVKAMVITLVKGFFRDFSGFMHADANGIPHYIEINIEADSITTENLDRDNHLVGPHFFDVKNYPHLVFKSTEIKPVDEDGNFKVYGNLTIKNITRNICLQAEFGGKITDVAGDDRVGYSAEGNLNRFELGLLWDEKMGDGAPVISPNVKLELEAEFVKLNPLQKI